MQTIGIVGYGTFGAFLHVLITRFAPGAQVKVFSSRSAPDGANFFTLEQVAQCDAVILSVPILAFEETLARLLPLVRADTVIIDVATVKMHTVEVLKRLAPKQSYIATHPMFGPESYQKKSEQVEGFRVVIAESSLPEGQKEKLTAFLRQCGFTVVEMSAGNHDKHLAETLFLTHFVGQVVSRADFVRTKIDTVSFEYLMDAAESVRHDTALFQDVYLFNP